MQRGSQGVTRCRERGKDLEPRVGFSPAGISTDWGRGGHTAGTLKSPGSISSGVGVAGRCVNTAAAAGARAAGSALLERRRRTEAEWTRRGQ